MRCFHCDPKNTLRTCSHVHGVHSHKIPSTGVIHSPESNFFALTSKAPLAHWINYKPVGRLKVSLQVNWLEHIEESSSG